MAKMEQAAADTLAETRAERQRRSSRPTPPIEKKLYRMKELVAIVGRCRAAIYEDVRNNRFPKPIRLGPKAVAWLVRDIDLWLEQRTAERDCTCTSPAVGQTARAKPAGSRIHTMIAAHVQGPSLEGDHATAAPTSPAV